MCPIFKCNFTESLPNPTVDPHHHNGSPQRSSAEWKQHLHGCVLSSAVLTECCVPAALLPALTALPPPTCKLLWQQLLWQVGAEMPWSALLSGTHLHPNVGNVSDFPCWTTQLFASLGAKHQTTSMWRHLKLLPSWLAIHMPRNSARWLSPVWNCQQLSWRKLPLFERRRGTNTAHEMSRMTWLLAKWLSPSERKINTQFSSWRQPICNLRRQKNQQHMARWLGAFLLEIVVFVLVLPVWTCTALFQACNPAMWKRCTAAAVLQSCVVAAILRHFLLLDPESPISVWAVHNLCHLRRHVCCPQKPAKRLAGFLFQATVDLPTIYNLSKLCSHWRNHPHQRTLPNIPNQLLEAARTMLLYPLFWLPRGADKECHLPPGSEALATSNLLGDSSSVGWWWPVCPSIAGWGKWPESGSSEAMQLMLLGVLRSPNGRLNHVEGVNITWAAPMNSTAARDKSWDWEWPTLNGLQEKQPESGILAINQFISVHVNIRLVSASPHSARHRSTRTGHLERLGWYFLGIFNFRL